MFLSARPGASLGGAVNLRQFVERYGLAIAVVVGLALVVALLPGNAERRGPSPVEAAGAAPGAASAPTPGAATDVTAAGGGEAGGATGVDVSQPGAAVGGRTGRSAPGPGTVPAGPQSQAPGGGEVVFGQGPCRPDGRQAGISKYMPPCVRWTGTDNGGATFRGVTRDKVLIVRYLAQEDPATRAILQSAQLSDSPETVRRAYQVLFRYSNLHYETYGREVVFQDYRASGPNESDEAMKADALKIATEIKPFAVIEGDPAFPMATTLIRELAQRGVLCMCSTTLSSAFYTELPPLVFSSLPTIDEYAAHTAEYVAKRLAGQKAVFAGDELNPAQGYRNKVRTFGLVYLEGARGRRDPEGQRAHDAFVREFARYGLRFAKEIGYLYDPGRNQQDMTNIIAQFRNAGVTTVIPVWDPLTPIILTQEASRQLYFPEWFVVGTGLSDTTTAGRLYDQSQWRHAFGISPLWVTWTRVENSAGYREYHHAAPGEAKGREGVLINIYRTRIQTLFRGIHMAGPRLTNDTFVAGQFAYPPTGGTAALPLVFLTRQFPTEIKDFTEVWYDANARGPDERSMDGQGMMMKANGGRRYRAGEWPQRPPDVYKPGGVAVSDNPQGGRDPAHEQDGHTHPPNKRCLSCA
jgi:hypothetical protein